MSKFQLTFIKLWKNWQLRIVACFNELFYYFKFFIFVLKFTQLYLKFKASFKRELNISFSHFRKTRVPDKLFQGEHFPSWSRVIFRLEKQKYFFVKLPYILTENALVNKV